MRKTSPPAAAPRPSPPHHLLAVCLLCALLGATGCGEDTVSSLLVSNEDEVKLGVGVDQEIESQYAIVDESDPVALWARQLVEPLQAASGEFRDPAAIGGYKVEVLADNTLVNAFAAPGGYTYLSTGLILEASSCAEVAGVMGHELAHVTERHSVNALVKQYGVAQLASWFFGESLVNDGVQLAFGFLQSTQFSQDNEAEADSVGLRIAYNAGYNPYGLVDFFDALLQIEQENGGTPDFLQFLSSHPASEDRVRDISAEIERRYGDQVQPGVSPPSYECVGTSMSLAEVQQRIRSGQLTIRQGTGGGGGG